MTKYTFCMITSGFVKSVHVKLPDETIDFVVPKVPWQNYLLKFINILNDELSSRGRPISDFAKFLILDKKYCTLRISYVLAIKPAISLF